jgi:hypothetical protein
VLIIAGACVFSEESKDLKDNKFHLKLQITYIDIALLRYTIASLAAISSNRLELLLTMKIFFCVSI